LADTGADLGDLGVIGHFLGFGLELVNDGLHGQINAPLQIHGVRTGGNRFCSFLDDRLGEHRRCRRTVTGKVTGLRGNLTHHLRAHVLELVLKLDLLGDGHAVLGHTRGTVRFIEHDVAALGAEGHPDRMGQGLDAA
jgi:hypothetical protein